MQPVIEFVIRHGYAVLIAWVFAEQVGLPIPSMPILLAAGALAGRGRMNLATALALSVVAATAADSLWFQLGRVRGVRVLRWLCRISLEPDSCVRQTEDAFSRHGARTLLFSKFVPGLNTVAPPLAGIVDMRAGRFLLFDALGSLLWAGSFLALGFVFSDEIEAVAERAESTGTWALIIFGGLLGSYAVFKFVARRRFLRELRIARISVDDLKARIDSGEKLIIVDLRHTREFEEEPQTIPGALRMNARDLQDRPKALPLDRDVILFCT